GVRTRGIPVAVGAPEHATPLGVYRIAQVVWNPTWTPPEAEWAKGRVPEPPGSTNPMGRVKMPFFEDYYIHGTSESSSLGRASSHGCVRVANPDMLALARLVHRYGSPAVAEAVLDSLTADPSRTRTIRVDRPPELRSVYHLAEVTDDRLEIHPDVYGLEPGRVEDRALEAIAGAGGDTTAIDRDRLAAAVERGRGRHTAVPLRELYTPATGGRPQPRSASRERHARGERPPTLGTNRYVLRGAGVIRAGAGARGRARGQGTRDLWWRTTPSHIGASTPPTRERPMRFVRILLAATVAAVPGSPILAQDFEDVRIETHRAAPGIYMLVGRGGNIGVSAGDDGVFLIDDQYAPLTDKIRAAIAELSDEPVRFVLNTHWHGDHTGGNENLGEAGALIVAHENVRSRMS
ncbi:MAG: L,D-transpeptidase family protein, partial [Gemmatimonadetes bacterium]|nr:L,D-transpeptidase family protein [Gemmatimonadota bacterium]NIX46924.1 L,D-transpeptidase family protein [Gemmatimonadota bacterium]